MQTKSSASRSTGVCPSMPVSAVWKAISPVCGVDEPPVFVVGLAGQRVSDLFEV
jgi:hypothetical protein